MSDARLESVGRRNLTAVFDESGKSNVPDQAEDADFALAAVVFAGRPAFRDLLALDSTLQRLTGTEDYKYRQVRQITAARLAVVDALSRQRGLIRVFCYYAAGGAFVEQSKRELHAVKYMNGKPKDIADAEETLRRMLADPRREGLRDAINTSIPAMSAWAATRRQRIKVYFDDRTDLADIADELHKTMSTSVVTRRFCGDAYDWMDWGGRCPADLSPAARVADVITGDFRATLKKHGAIVWKQVCADGFVGRHAATTAATDSIWSGPVPLPLVGFLPDSVWDEQWQSGSTTTTMFRAYQRHLLNGMMSLYSPCGRGLIMKRNGDGYDMFQQMD